MVTSSNQNMIHHLALIWSMVTACSKTKKRSMVKIRKMRLKMLNRISQRSTLLSLRSQMKCKRCLMINKNWLKSQLKHKKLKRLDKRLLMLRRKLPSWLLRQRRLRLRLQPLQRQLMHNRREPLMKPMQQNPRPRLTKPVPMPPSKSMTPMSIRLRKPERPLSRPNSKLIVPSTRLKSKDVSRRSTIDKQRRLKIARKGMMLRLLARKHLLKLRSKLPRLRPLLINKLLLTNRKRSRHQNQHLQLSKRPLNRR